MSKRVEASISWKMVSTSYLKPCFNKATFLTNLSLYQHEDMLIFKKFTFLVIKNLTFLVMSKRVEASISWKMVSTSYLKPCFNKATFLSNLSLYQHEDMLTFKKFTFLVVKNLTFLVMSKRVEASISWKMVSTSYLKPCFNKATF